MDILHIYHGRTHRHRRLIYFVYIYEHKYFVYIYLYIHTYVCLYVSMFGYILIHFNIYDNYNQNKTYVWMSVCLSVFYSIKTFSWPILWQNKRTLCVHPSMQHPSVSVSSSSCGLACETFETFETATPQRFS